MSKDLFDQALASAAQARRIGREEALALAAASDPDAVHAIGQAALKNRRKRHGRRATYVFNLQINPSNICSSGCRFCRFSRPADARDAYVLDEAEILERVAELQPSEVHVVGGLNHIWSFGRSLALVEALRERHPHLFIKAFTAVEMDWFARCEDIEAEHVLRAFAAAGLDGMPGGGAEVFSQRVRQLTCASKLSPTAWLAVHRTAHRLGLVSNATMLAGLGETSAERVDHLLALRAAQDESKGFACFVPLFYQPIEDDALPLGPTEKLAVIALARLVLDNFAHVKAYWPMLGLETAAAALSWGADDLDGTLGEERIVHAAGASTPKAMARERLEETIRLGGFEPVERDGAFSAVTKGVA